MTSEANQDQAVLYVLGELSPAARENFERTMSTDAELAAFVADLGESAADLALLVPARQPAPALRDNILAAAKASRPSVAVLPDSAAKAEVGQASPAAKLRPNPFPVVISMAAAACAMAAALFLGLQFKFANDQLNVVRADFKLTEKANKELQEQVEVAAAQLAKAQAASERQAAVANAAVKDREEITTMLEENMERLAAAEARADLAQMKVVTLTSKLQADYVASIAWDEQNQSGVLRVTRLPENAADKAYQLWVIDADTELPVSAGVFRLGADGTARVSFSPVTPVRKAAVFAVSLENAGGSTSGGPEGEIVIAGAQAD